MSDNNIFIYDFLKKQWLNINCSNWKVVPPAIDSHCAVNYKDTKLIIVCGYLGEIGEYSNSVF